MSPVIITWSQVVSSFKDHFIDGNTFDQRFWRIVCDEFGSESLGPYSAELGLYRAGRLIQLIHPLIVGYSVHVNGGDRWSAEGDTLTFHFANDDDAVWWRMKYVK